MELRFALEAGIICPLLRIAAAALALLHSGAALTVQQALGMVDRAGKDHSALHRSLLPGRFETHSDLISTAETLIEDRLRDEREEAEFTASGHQRGPPGAAA